VPRVSRDEYAANLEAIGELAGAAGAAVVLITAPTSFERLGVHPAIVGTFAADAAQAIERHREYNDIDREVARRRGWGLADLAREMPDERTPELMMTDGIHFTAAGLTWVAERIASSIPALDPRLHGLHDQGAVSAVR